MSTHAEAVGFGDSGPAWRTGVGQKDKRGDHVPGTSAPAIYLRPIEVVNTVMEGLVKFTRPLTDRYKERTSADRRIRITAG